MPPVNDELEDQNTDQEVLDDENDDLENDAAEQEEEAQDNLESSDDDEQLDDDDSEDQEADSEDDEEVEGDEDDDEEGDDILTIDGKPLDASDIDEKENTPILRKVRSRVKEEKKKRFDVTQERDDYKQQLDELVYVLNNKDEALAEIGEEPDLWDDDIDGDSKKLATKLIEYEKKKEKLEAPIKKAKEQYQAQVKKFRDEEEQIAKDYVEKRSNLKREDYEDAEAEISSHLSEAQISELVSLADNAPNVVYAIYKIPQLAEELKKHDVSTKKGQKGFTIALDSLEKRLGKTKNKSKKKIVGTKPEKTLKGKRKAAGNMNRKLKQLEKQSTDGDRSAIIALKKQQRQNAS